VVHHTSFYKSFCQFIYFLQDKGRTTIENSFVHRRYKGSLETKAQFLLYKKVLNLPSVFFFPDHTTMFTMAYARTCYSIGNTKLTALSKKPYKTNEIHNAVMTCN